MSGWVGARLHCSWGGCRYPLALSYTAHPNSSCVDLPPLNLSNTEISSKLYSLNSREGSGLLGDPSRHQHRWRLRPGFLWVFSRWRLFGEKFLQPTSCVVASDSACLLCPQSSASRPLPAPAELVQRHWGSGTLLGEGS